MTVTLNHQGRPARRRSVWGHNTGTTTEDVYVCRHNCVAEVRDLHVHNFTGNANITIEWYVAADIYKSHVVAGKN